MTFIYMKKLELPFPLDVSQVVFEGNWRKTHGV